MQQESTVADSAAKGGRFGEAGLTAAGWQVAGGRRLERLERLERRLKRLAWADRERAGVGYTYWAICVGSRPVQAPFTAQHAKPTEKPSPRRLAREGRVSRGRQL
jgi:hypothetical protein